VLISAALLAALFVLAALPAAVFVLATPIGGGD
jgi:hypothetical protein